MLKTLYLTILVLLTTFNMFCAEDVTNKEDPVNYVISCLKHDDNCITYEKRTKTQPCHVIQVAKVKEWQQISPNYMQAFWTYKASCHYESWNTDYWGQNPPSYMHIKKTKPDFYNEKNSKKLFEQIVNEYGGY